MTTVTTAKDWASDQEVRWCPGCGDYAVLKAVQRTMPDLGVAREEDGFRLRHRLLQPLSLITWRPTASTRSTAARRRSRPASSSPIPSSTCGSSPAMATRCRSAATTRCTCSAATSTCQILLFNNEIYGLTKGQYSPTSRVGTRSPSTPFGSVDRPATPGLFALGSGARFVARGIDVHKNLPDVLKAAHAHKGASLRRNLPELHRL